MTTYDNRLRRLEGRQAMPVDDDGGGALERLAERVVAARERGETRPPCAEDYAVNPFEPGTALSRLFERAKLQYADGAAA